MAFEKYLENKKAFIFGLDDVVYPEKDYLLQVYYLFSEFMAYSEQIDSAAIIDFMRSEYENLGPAALFEKTAAKFQIPEKYTANFLLLHQNARLPLKLLLFKQILLLLQEIVVERKEIFLLVDGDPVVQLNKIRQLEWHGLEQYLKVYFTAEFAPKPSLESLDFLLTQHVLNKEDTLMIGHSETDRIYAEKAGVEFLPLTKLL